MKAPDEKAKELIAKFKPHAMQHWSELSGWDKDSLELNAALCASVCVDEIIANLSTTSILAGGITYWKAVKTEIENL